MVEDRISVRLKRFGDCYEMHFFHEITIFYMKKKKNICFVYGKHVCVSVCKRINRNESSRPRRVAYSRLDVGKKKNTNQPCDYVKNPVSVHAYDLVR